MATLEEVVLSMLTSQQEEKSAILCPLPPSLSPKRKPVRRVLQVFPEWVCAEAADLCGTPRVGR
ncbi:hypothetical protein EYF80_049393 [Liparis tanakae]|uniref:Uncharacterized protein n=1 Tax=Liparis tanakae TaxID=230148 RepID=A0A4Z2FGX4_9TELE|nr:hypothetical protein EYF80_049393 [Liparis tanakae]